MYGALQKSLIDQYVRMGGIPDEKTGIIASATMCSWVADPVVASLNPSSDSPPVELVRIC